MFATSGGSIRHCIVCVIVFKDLAFWPLSPATEGISQPGFRAAFISVTREVNVAEVRLASSCPSSLGRVYTSLISSVLFYCQGDICLIML
jgi:hypothetical protein